MQTMRLRVLRRAAVVCLGLSATTFGACGGDNFSLTAFRDSAAQSVTDGLSTLVEGVVSGFFAGLQFNDGAESEG